jgi:hypothetical protein
MPIVIAPIQGPDATGSDVPALPPPPSLHRLSAASAQGAATAAEQARVSITRRRLMASTIRSCRTADDSLD